MLGYDYVAFVLVQTHATNTQQIYNFLKNTPNILHITKLMGRYNIIIIVTLTEVNEIDKVISYVKGNPHIVNVDIGIAWNLVNVDHYENLEIKEFEGK